MIRPAVTVSLVEEARGGPFVYWHDLADACKKAGKGKSKGKKRSGHGGSK